MDFWPTTDLQAAMRERDGVRSMSTTFSVREEPT